MTDGTRQQSRCDYALVDAMVPTRSARIVIPPWFVSDHWAIKLQIYSSHLSTHRRYLHNRSRLPNVRPEPDEQLPNQVFTQLLTHHKRPTPATYPAWDAWIAVDTWALIDKRNAALRRCAPQPELRTIRKSIRKKIKRDRAIRLRNTGEEIEKHLSNDNAKEAWRLVKVWYRHNARAVPPTPADLQAIDRDYRALYTEQTPPEEPVRGLVTFNIPDETPAEDEIIMAMKTLRSGRAPGASGMSVEDIKRWYAERETNPSPWLLTIQLVQHAFQTGVVPTRARANTLVLIPKPEPGQVRGIGLLEPIWKLVSAIINRRLMQNITFHDDLHGFLPARGTGTACLEAKLEAQLAFRSGRPLYQVFLDLSKAYDSLDRARTIIILRDYGVGPNIIRLIAKFWERHTVIPRQQAFYGTPFHASRGLATGDIPAPAIYNIVTDAILRRWYLELTTHGLTTRGRFYADDGQLRDYNAEHLQSALTIMEKLFLRVGLKINGRKTKALTTVPTVATTQISDVAYKRRMERTGDTYRERKQARIVCPLCDLAMQARSLATHFQAKHPTIPIPRPTDPGSHMASIPADYIITEPDRTATITCPVPECQVNIAGGWYGMRRHFAFRHKTATIQVVEEGELPSCTECGFQCALPHTAHQRSKFCKQGRQCRVRHVNTQAIIMARDYAPEFQAGATVIDNVPAFRYLGRWMVEDDSDTMAVTQNILKARMRWGQLCRLLTRHGASRRIMGLFYKATIQSVLLYGAETWTLTQPLLRMLTSFHHRCARYLARMENTLDEKGNWVSPPSEIARNKAGLFSIEEYIQRRINTFLPFIQARAIYQECEWSEPTQATVNHPIWWAAYPRRPATQPRATQEEQAAAREEATTETAHNEMPFLPPR